jgi:hypothetical protein
MEKGALFQIAPAQETVTLRGVAVPVPGVSIAGLVKLVTRYPELVSLLGGDKRKKDVNIDPAKFLVAAPAAAATAIAYGLGYVDDEEAENHIASLPFGDQLKLFGKVLTVTVGEDGVDPLVARLNEVTASLGGTGDRATT